MMQGTGCPLPSGPHPLAPQEGHSRGGQASVQRGGSVGIQQQQEAGEECPQHQPLGHGHPALLLRQRHLRHLRGRRAGQALAGQPQGASTAAPGLAGSRAAFNIGTALCQLYGPPARSTEGQRDKHMERHATGVQTEMVGKASAERDWGMGKEEGSAAWFSFNF